MKNTLLLLGCLLLRVVAEAQTPACGPRYLTPVFPSTTVRTVAFGQNLNRTGALQTLLADVYTPANDPMLSGRAAIVFVHGGGFVGGTRNSPEIADLCTKLARRGYVVASIDYRLGMLNGSDREQGQAVLRAVQDLNAFVRYVKANSAVAGVDTAKVLVVGSSAGGYTALAKGYLNYGEFPAFFDTTGVGSLEGRSNALRNTSGVAAVYSMSGAVADTAWLQPGDVPVGCVQSIDDPCIFWNSGQNCTLSAGNRTYGSRSIYLRARHQGIATTLHGYRSAQHDLGLNDPLYRDTTVQLLSNFYYGLLCRAPLAAAAAGPAPALTLAPNPAANSLTINGLPAGPAATVTVLDLLGRTHLTATTSTGAVPLAALAAGTYVVRVEQAGRTYRAKLQKE